MASFINFVTNKSLKSTYCQVHKVETSTFKTVNKHLSNRYILAIEGQCMCSWTSIS